MKKLFGYALVASAFAFSLFTANGEEVKPVRRPLRAALYPFVPDKKGLFWKLEQEFEAANPYIDLQIVDLSADYYSGGLKTALGSGKPPAVDVAEVDTIFLRDLIEDKLITEFPAGQIVDEADFLTVSVEAARLDGKYYGVPHWVCGNFLFFRADDPEAGKLAKVISLDGLERVLGRPSNEASALLMDLRGGVTLGEAYLDSLLDTHGDFAKALEHTNPESPDSDALKSLARLFRLTPGGLCDSEKHHDFGQFYPRQFARRKARVFVGYSEQIYYTVDEYLHGIPDGEPAVGKIDVDFDNGKTTSQNDIRAISAPFADAGSNPLAWVDVLSLRADLNEQTKKDAISFVQFYTSKEFNLAALRPELGEAPRHLLPARGSIYSDATLTAAAPLYSTFLEVMKRSKTGTDRNLNDRLRKIGKAVEKAGFPVNF